MKPVRKSFQLFLSGLLLLLGMQLACAFSGSQPSAPVSTARPAILPTAPAAVPTQVQGTDLPPAILESRLLTLEFPPLIRAGDSDVVRLTLEVDDQGKLTPTVSAAGNVTQGQVINIPNVYETHNIMAEARLDMAGVDIRPRETVSESLLPGQKLTFYWSILPADVGKYKGTVWFFLRFIPKTGGIESRQALSAQLIEIEATSLFGIKAELARWLGFSGALLSSILGFPFLEAILKWLWKRLWRKG